MCVCVCVLVVQCLCVCVCVCSHTLPSVAKDAEWSLSNGLSVVQGCVCHALNRQGSSSGELFRKYYVRICIQFGTFPFISHAVNMLRLRFDAHFECGSF